MKTFTSAELAEKLGGRLVGAPDVRVSGVAGLAEAGPEHVSFLGNPRYRAQVLPSKAGVVLAPPSFEEPPPEGRAWIVCENPSAAFTRIVAEFAPPPPEFPSGVHPSAVVSEEADVPASVHVGAGAVIEAGACIGERTIIGAGVYVGHETRIGADCFIHPNVTIRERCIIGNRVIIHSGSVIGSDGFGYNTTRDGRHEKIPQVGIVQIDDDVEIGALVAVDRARFGRTWIQEGTKIDNLVQIAHNVVIGRRCLIVAQVGIAGSSRVGDGAILAGQVGVAGHITIGERAVLLAQSGVSKDVPGGAVLIGTPAVPRTEFVERLSAGKRLQRLTRRVAELTERLEALEKRLQGDDERSGGDAASG